VTYCHMIQKGMFVVFLKNHNMQERILEKKFWNVGRLMFRAYPWSPKCNIEKMVARAPPNWVEIKNLNVEFWSFISQILKPLGFVLQIEQSQVTLPHLNARVLVALAPKVDLIDKIPLEFDGESFYWDISLLANISAYFHCRCNGHTKKEMNLQKVKFNVVNKNGPNNNMKNDLNPMVGEKNSLIVSTNNKKVNDDVDVNDNLNVQSRASDPVGMPTSNKFISLLNPLFEEEFEVVPTKSSSLEVIHAPLAASLPRNVALEVPSDKALVLALNAQQLALATIKERACKM